MLHQAARSKLDLLEEDVARPMGVAVHDNATFGTPEDLVRELLVHMAAPTARHRRVLLGHGRHLLAAPEGLVLQPRAEAVVGPREHLPCGLEADRPPPAVLADFLAHFLGLELGDQHRVEARDEVECHLAVTLDITSSQ